MRLPAAALAGSSEGQSFADAERRTIPARKAVHPIRKWRACGNLPSAYGNARRENTPGSANWPFAPQLTNAWSRGGMGEFIPPVKPESSLLGSIAPGQRRCGRTGGTRSRPERHPGGDGTHHSWMASATACCKPIVSGTNRWPSGSMARWLVL